MYSLCRLSSLCAAAQVTVKDVSIRTDDHTMSPFKATLRNVEFKTESGEFVRGVLMEPIGPARRAAIILVHGLLSTHEELGTYPESFCQRGYVSLAIDLRGHGESDGIRGFISQERMVEDVKYAMDYVAALPTVNPHRIALFGHSLGAAAVLCAASSDSRVAAVVAGAVVGRIIDAGGPLEVLLYHVLDRVNRLQKAVTHKPIRVPYRVSYEDILLDPNARAKAKARGFLQRTAPADTIPTLLRQDAYPCARNLGAPALIIASECDRVVKRSNTRKVFDLIPGEKEWYEIKGSGHSFPMDQNGSQAFERIVAWLDRHLGPSP